MILKLFSNCIIINGIKRSLILDFQRNSYFLVPKDLVKFLEMAKENDYDEIYRNLDNSDKTTISEYLEFLFKNEIAFFSKADLEIKFIDFPSVYETPYLLTNISLELSSESIPSVRHLGEKLSGMRIQCIEFVCFNEDIPPFLLFEFIDALSLIDYDELRVILKYTPEYTIDYVKKICNGHVQIFSFLLHSGVRNHTERLKNGLTSITFQESPLNNCFDCGKIASKYFTSSKEFYFEGLTRNTCLNKKIAIDKRGNIKNCLSHLISFGNIFEADLIETIQSSDFQKLWNITKDKVKKCQVCEFRMICPDCRIFIEDPNDIFSAPLKCGYDPYTGIWNNWEDDSEKAQIFKGYKLKAELT